MQAKSKNNFTNNLVLKVAVAVPIHRLFDYLAPSESDLNQFVPGLRLEVSFGNRQKIGYLIETAQTSELAEKQLKTITRILDDKPLISPQDLQLMLWASHYYHHPAGEVISLAYPATLRKNLNAPPNTIEKHYALTSLGTNFEADQLKRSSKQQQLLIYFQHHAAASVNELELKQLNFNWRVPLKALINKQLIQPSTTLNQPIPIPFQDKNTPSTLKTPLSDTQQLLALNPEQHAAVETVVDSLHKFAVFLLDGVTGSGKTEVYMQIIQKVLASGQQVMVLLPEISLTPQLEHRFRQRFAINLELSHSGLTDKQRVTAWFNMQRGTSSILLGTRSAVFTPLKHPGLIILDEEHDPSFKQQEGFRFSARDVAIMRGKLLNIPVVLGSATPSLESLHNAIQKRYRHLILTERAGNALTPAMHLLDIRNKKMQHGLSEALLEEIRKALEKGEQVLIFFNRRGFAPTLICHNCGWIARCQHCDANLVIHHHIQQLRCHHCDKEQRLPQACPACASKELVALGLGTERIEDAFKALFPDKTLIRLDRDTTRRKGSLEQYLAQINTGEANIILGTQMLAKGHHFPNVTLAALIDVDSGLFNIDFRAAERLAQLIIQVSGRAGRAEKPGKVVLQTRHPEHPLLNTLTLKGYREFAKTALKERKQASLPPFSHHALFCAHTGDADSPLRFLHDLAQHAQTHKTEDIRILGPVVAPMAKRAGEYRFQLLLQSPERKNLQALLTLLIDFIGVNKPIKSIRWSLDVDPIDLW